MIIHTKQNLNSHNFPSDRHNLADRLHPTLDDIVLQRPQPRRGRHLLLLLHRGDVAGPGLQVSAAEAALGGQRQRGLVRRRRREVGQPTRICDEWRDEQGKFEFLYLLPQHYIEPGNGLQNIVK